MTILAALDDPELFGGLLRRPETFMAWRAFLAALFALPMTEAELATYRECTGRTEVPAVPFSAAWLVIGSSCAFVAAVMTVITLGLLPVVWRGGRRLDSWTIGRKARFTLTTLIFTGFGVMLGLWGALEPWRS